MKKAYGWYLVGLLAACNFLNYAQRNILFASLDDLRIRFDRPSDAALGLLTTAYMGAHALGTVWAGWLGDRVDRRRLLAIAAVLWSTGALCAAIAPDMITLALARALTGLATAAVVPVANAIISEAFPDEQKASVLAVFNLGLFLGGVGGFAIGREAGFPASVIVLAIPGLVVAGAVARLDVPPQVGHASPGFGDLIRQARSLLRIRSLRWVMVSTTLMAFASGGFTAWLVDFLEKDKGMPPDSATGLLGIAFFGGLAGVITGGRVADRLRRRRAHGRVMTIAIGMSSTVPCAILCIFAPVGPLLYIGAIATMFFISWYHGPMAASVDDLSPDGRAVTTQALVIFAMHLFGTAPASWLVGVIRDATDYKTAMLFPTGAVLLAALAMTRTFRTFGDDAAGSTRGDDGAMTVFDA